MRVNQIYFHTKWYSGSNQGGNITFFNANSALKILNSYLFIFNFKSVYCSEPT